MFTATASALPQSPASLLEVSRQGPLSLGLAPRDTRPVERSDESGSTTARSRPDADGAAAGEPDAQAEGAQDQEVQLPVLPPDDPAAERRGRNMNMIFDQESGRPIIEIINPRTGEVMDRIPPENLLERAQKEKLPTRANLVDETA